MISSFWKRETYHLPCKPTPLGTGFCIIKRKHHQRDDRSIQEYDRSVPGRFFLLMFFIKMLFPPHSLSYFAISAMLAIDEDHQNQWKVRSLMFQLLPCLNSCSMTFPISRILLPPRRSEMTKVVRDGTNTMVIPLIIPGTLRGRMILQKVCILVCSQISCCIYDIAVNLGQVHCRSAAP